MSKYLAKLKEREATRAGFGGFGGATGEASEKNASPKEGLEGFGGASGGASQKNDDVATVASFDLCAGALMADGPYLPWGPYLTPDRLKAMQQAVIDVVTEISRIERWRDDYYDIIVVEIGRQPISTLLPDLDYFLARLAAARSQ